MPVTTIHFRTILTIKYNIQPSKKASMVITITTTFFSKRRLENKNTISLSTISIIVEQTFPFSLLLPPIRQRTRKLTKNFPNPRLRNSILLLVVILKQQLVMIRRRYSWKGCCCGRIINLRYCKSNANSSR